MDAGIGWWSAMIVGCYRVVIKIVNCAVVVGGKIRTADGRHGGLKGAKQPSFESPSGREVGNGESIDRCDRDAPAQRDG